MKSAVPLGREITLLLVLAALPALLSAWLHPRRPVLSWSKPAVEQVTLAQVDSWKASVLWVDAREAGAYARGHIPGAFSLNETEWERLLHALMQAREPNHRIVVYCDSERCNASEEVALRLRRELNVEAVFVLQGGWTAWRQNQR